MPAVEYEAFVVKVRGKFCRFGSYQTISLVENPLGATLYMRKRDADKRILDVHYMATNAADPVFPREMKVERISMAIVR